MQAPGRFLRGFVVLVAGLLAWAGPARADPPLVLDPPTMRQLANEVLAAGEARQALALTDALLARDPDDTTALIIRSQALRALGRTGEARQAALRAWRAAEADPARYGAAMAMAQALAAEERRTLAQLWLRRAVQVAPSDQAEALARRDFRYVRSRNPWIFRFDVSAAPSSNVNGGSARGTMDLLGLEDLPIPKDLQALSGLEFAAGLITTYRLPSTAISRTEFEFSLRNRSVVLSDEARKQAPYARNSDYAFTAIEAGVLHRRVAFGPDTLVALAARVGHNWYAGDNLTDYFGASVGVDQELSDRLVVNADLDVERQWRLDNAINSADVVTLVLGGDYIVGDAGQLSLEVTGRRSWSRSPEIMGDGLMARLGWTFAEPLPGDVTVSTAVTLGVRDFPDSAYAVGGRVDRSVEFDLGLGFNRLGYMGFSPVMNLRGEVTKSNADLFDARSLGVTFGFRSAF